MSGWNKSSLDGNASQNVGKSLRICRNLKRPRASTKSSRMYQVKNCHVESCCENTAFLKIFYSLSVTWVNPIIYRSKLYFIQWQPCVKCDSGYLTVKTVCPLHRMLSMDICSSGLTEGYNIWDLISYLHSEHQYQFGQSFPEHCSS